MSPLMFASKYRVPRVTKLLLQLPDVNVDEEEQVNRYSLYLYRYNRCACVPMTTIGNVVWCGVRGAGLFCFSHGIGCGGLQTFLRWTPLEIWLDPLEIDSKQKAQDSLEAVTALLAKGANPNHLDRLGRTPVMQLARKSFRFKTEGSVTLFFRLFFLLWRFFVLLLCCRNVVLGPGLCGHMSSE